MVYSRVKYQFRGNGTSPKPRTILRLVSYPNTLLVDQISVMIEALYAHGNVLSIRTSLQRQTKRSISYLNTTGLVPLLEQISR